MFELERTSNTIEIFVYDKYENFLPHKQHLHGSANYELDTFMRNDHDEYSLFNQEIEITRSKWKSLDKEGERCSQGHRTLHAERCITR